MVIEADYVGDEVRCGQCHRVIAVGVVPARAGAKVPCKSCSEWVELGLPQVTPRPPRSTRFPLGG